MWGGLLVHCTGEITHCARGVHTREHELSISQIVLKLHGDVRVMWASFGHLDQRFTGRVKQRILYRKRNPMSIKFPLGFCAVTFKNKDRAISNVVWDSSRLINGHTLLLGMSGSGKTHTLKRMLTALQLQSEGQTRFHVFDVHGDIRIEGASEVMFAELTPYGLNPLRVNPDPHFGGVRKCIQNFIKTVNKASSQLGVKQEAVLRNILFDVYRNHGFNPDDPRSWIVDEAEARLVSDGSDNRLYLDVPFAEKDAARSLGARWDPSKTLWWVPTDQYDPSIFRWAPKTVGRTHPHLGDVLSYANRLLKLSFLGSDQTAVTNLEKFARHASALTKRKIEAARSARDHVEDPAALDALEKAKEKAIDSYVRYVNTVQTGNEFDSLIKYDSTDVLKSVVDRLESLRATGIFKGAAAPFDFDAPVWTYRLNALRPEEKKMFVLFRLQEIFAEAIQRGEQKQLRDVVVLDEAHLYVDNDDANILNTLAREARKFGVAIIAANQNADLPDGFLSSLATKIVLGIDEMYWNQAESKMRIDKRLLAWVRSREYMAVQLKEIGNTRSDWRWVVLPWLPGDGRSFKKGDLDAVPTLTPIKPPEDAVSA